MENINNQYDFTKLTESFQALLSNKGLMHQILDLFPLMIEVFDPDGTSIFMNRAGMEFNNIQDVDLVVGKYNLKHDPVCLKIVGQEVIERIFRGESVSVPDFPAPIQDLVDRGIIKEKPYEAATMDLFFLPVWNEDKFLCSICLFILKRKYNGLPEISRAKEYIDCNWHKEYDPQAVARAAHISYRHLSALFKQNTGMRMHDYYNKVKVDRIKEKLADRNYNIKEAFAACGEDSRSGFARTFKELTGMTPKEFRSNLK